MAEQLKLFTRRTPGMTEAEVAAILTLMRETEVGAVLTYASMSHALGRDVRRQCMSALTVAIRRAVDEGMVFDVVPTVGYKRLNDLETLAVSRKSIAQVHRKAERTLKKLATVDPASLDNDARIRYSSTVSAMGTLSFFSSTSNVRKIEESSPKTELPIGQIFELFR